jgi:asparagine synthase (glutamine-hydrolysing)
MSLILNDINIVNFLTLRYDPTFTNLHAPLKSDYFVEKEIENLDSEIENIVQLDLESKLSQNKVSKVSIALSGGVDSGFTLKMIRKHFPEIHIDSVCVGFGDDDDEISEARNIAQQYDSEFHECIVDNALLDLPKLISIVGMPKWNLYQYYSLEQATRYSNVFFSGDGGDETFGGYVFRYRKFLQEVEKIDNPSWLDKSKIYLSCHDRDWVPNQDDIFDKNIGFSWFKIHENFRPYFDNHLHPLNQLFLADFNGKLLHDWIPTNNNFGEHLGIEINSLFLNPRLIALAASLPWHSKYDYGKNIGKLPILSLLNKDSDFGKFEGVKKGFSLNLLNLWRNHGREIVLSYLNENSDSVKNNIINLKWIDESIRLVDSTIHSDMKIRYVSKLFSLLSFEIWYRLFVSFTLKANTKL